MISAPSDLVGCRGGYPRRTRTGAGLLRQARVDGHLHIAITGRSGDPLGADDFEMLATSAYMLGRDDDCLGGLERAYHVHFEAGEALGAVRCAFWVGINLALRGEMGRATGWLGRAQRLVEREAEDCVERGSSRRTHPPGRSARRAFVGGDFWGRLHPIPEAGSPISLTVGV